MVPINQMIKVTSTGYVWSRLGRNE